MIACSARMTHAECQEHPNPRYKDGRCWHCHKPLLTPTRRNVRFERELTIAGARFEDSVAIIKMSEARCVSHHGEYTDDSMVIAPGRDLVRDVLEELADARSYLCFLAQENPDDVLLQERCKFALGHVVRAFNAVLAREGD